MSHFNDIAAVANGISCAGSLTKMCDVTDGTSETYLIGEKSLDPDYYYTGYDAGDNEDAMMGDNADISRWTTNSSYFWPSQDAPGLSYYEAFGSAHAVGFQMAFCDGSVAMISYSIDHETHRRLGNRKERCRSTEKIGETGASVPPYAVFHWATQPAAHRLFFSITPCPAMLCVMLAQPATWLAARVFTRKSRRLRIFPVNFSATGNFRKGAVLPAG